MYKGSSTSFGYVEKVEDQVPRCGMRGGEAEGSRAWWRAVAVTTETRHDGGGGYRRRVMA
jgi:hypothetical protein